MRASGARNNNKIEITSLSIKIANSRCKIQNLGGRVFSAGGYTVEENGWHVLLWDSPAALNDTYTLRIFLFLFLCHFSFFDHFNIYHQQHSVFLLVIAARENLLKKIWNYNPRMHA